MQDFDREESHRPSTATSKHSILGKSFEFVGDGIKVKGIYLAQEKNTSSKFSSNVVLNISDIDLAMIC